MPDEDATQDEQVEEQADEAEGEETEGPEEDEGEEGEGPDHAEALANLAEETALDRERIKATARQLREKLQARQEELGAITGGDEATQRLVATASALLDAKLFMLDEFAETFMPLIDSLARHSSECIADLQDWAEEDVEPYLSQLEGELPEGAPEDSVLLPNDGAAVDVLLAELHQVLTAGISQIDQNSREYQLVQTRLTHIQTVRARVLEITLQAEEPAPPPS